MPSQDELLNILADGRFHSGAVLGKQLAISRAAVWKRIRNLKDSGLVIDAVKGKGYRISQVLELLNHGTILGHLAHQHKSGINKLVLHQSISSTNQYLLDQAADGIHKYITLAEYQTAGRGRRGRQWLAPFAAGICMSVGWQFDPAPEPPAVLSLGAGVAVMNVLRLLGISGAGLKWPNDILWQNRKLGGILVETIMEAAGPCTAVIGIGLNYSFPLNDAQTAAAIELPWVDLSSIQTQLTSRNLLAAMLITEVLTVLEQIEHGAGAAIIERWRAYDCISGRQAELILPHRSVTGRVCGIDQQGALIMSINGQEQHFNYGEISLRPEA